MGTQAPNGQNNYGEVDILDSFHSMMISFIPNMLGHLLISYAFSYAFLYTSLRISFFLKFCFVFVCIEVMLLIHRNMKQKLETQKKEKDDT